MPKALDAKVPEGVFIDLFETKGPIYISKQFSISQRNVFNRRVYLERKLGRQITAPGPSVSGGNYRTRCNVSHPSRIPVSIPNGVVLVGSDAHIWPGGPSTAMRAFVRFCR